MLPSIFFARPSTTFTTMPSPLGHWLHVVAYQFCKPVTMSSGISSGDWTKSSSSGTPHAWNITAAAAEPPVNVRNCRRVSGIIIDFPSL
jgi:hypothetical protein